MEQVWFPSSHIKRRISNTTWFWCVCASQWKINQLFLVVRSVFFIPRHVAVTWIIDSLRNAQQVTERRESGQLFRAVCFSGKIRCFISSYWLKSRFQRKNDCLRSSVSNLEIIKAACGANGPGMRILFLWWRHGTTCALWFPDK